jgi:hypothetical protein
LKSIRGRRLASSSAEARDSPTVGCVATEEIYRIPSDREHVRVRTPRSRASVRVMEPWR